MATPTYIPIATTTLTSSASSVSFLGIPQDFRDLVLIIEHIGTTTQIARVSFNGDSSSSYSTVRMTGDGSSTSSGTATTSYFNTSLASTTIRGNLQMNILDYTATDKHKPVLFTNQYPNSGSQAVNAQAGRWANTSAISSISIVPSGGSFDTGSTFSIYGIASEVV